MAFTFRVKRRRRGLASDFSPSDSASMYFGLLSAVFFILLHCSKEAIATSSGPEIDSNIHKRNSGGKSENPESKKESWSIASIFRLNDVVKQETSETLEEGGFNRFAQTASPSNGSGRGGASTVVKPSMRFQLFSPLDTSKVAPFASRLLRDEEIVLPTSVDEPSTRNYEANDSKLWWVNAWSGHVPSMDHHSTEKEIQYTHNKDDLESIAIATLNEKSVAEPPANASYLPRKRNEPKRRRRNKDISSNRSAEGEILRASQEIPDPERRAREPVGGLYDIAASTVQFHADTHFVPQVDLEGANAETGEKEDPTPFTSSGHWPLIDNFLTLGLARKHPSLRLSTQLRSFRKVTANATGLHGLISGKREIYPPSNSFDEAYRGLVRRRIAAIDRARARVDLISNVSSVTRRRRGLFGRKEQISKDGEYAFIVKKQRDAAQEMRRRERVTEIDKQILAGQKRIMELSCEKDFIQRRPNPLWNYTGQLDPDPIKTGSKSHKSDEVSREFNFPPKDLVDDYLDMLFSSGRLVRLNHTDLWRNAVNEEDDEDDELRTPIAGDVEIGRRRRNGNTNSGNWLLRNGLGEKIGETAETAAYKAVCTAIMGVLARCLSAIHGVNIMAYSDIRLFMDQTPDLPPLAAGIIPGSGAGGNYAQEALSDAMRRGVRKKKRSKNRSFEGDDFMQRDAVVETLLSHCQLSAPLLQLFPLSWQRALLGNIITLVTAAISDFFEGMEFQILGHRLSFAFTPITEEDMIRHIGTTGGGFSRRRANTHEFESAVQATADSLSENLKFLDRWHERALGSGMLRSQIANLIARLVLTLVDDVLSGARMDMWAAHVGGPRLVAGLEYRTGPMEP
jgi:hypothetical protein